MAPKKTFSHLIRLTCPRDERALLILLRCTTTARPTCRRTARRGRRTAFEQAEVTGQGCEQPLSKEGEQFAREAALIHTDLSTSRTVLELDDGVPADELFLVRAAARLQEGAYDRRALGLDLPVDLRIAVGFGQRLALQHPALRLRE
jgi:hypothetical protein